ncbi:MAG: ATP-binding protein [Actinomycetota bacterium]
MAFVAALDPREFRREVSVVRALYNRSQVAASVMLASAAFHAMGGNTKDWPEVLVIGLIVLSIDWAANTVLVMVPVALMSRLSTAEVVRRVHGDSPLEHALGYLCLGLLAVILGAVYGVARGWGLVAALIPLALARQVFMRGRRLEDAAKSLAAKDRALVSGAEQTLLERRDERMAVAGELHDEVLPPLFKVHLMGQVLRQDLNSGRLLDLDEDLPELIVATEAAQSAIRGLLRDLRQSSLGPGGLNATLELLARQLEVAGSPSIQLDLSEVGGSSVCQLLAYQVTREALNNAARHSRASKISVRLFRESGLIRLVVEDDGIGFDPALVDGDQHFGLQLIAERVEAGRGRVVVDSRLGGGTRVMATLPPEI